MRASFTLRAVGESATLGKTIRDTARGVVTPAVREARVSKVLGPSLLEVAVRSLMGDRKTLPARGHEPRVRDDGAGGVELVQPVARDRVWVAEDESGALVVVTWEPV